MLKNNIELISHICSHLESCDQSESANVYISPFEAVTTNCSVCEENFDHPFDLIKHLDLVRVGNLFNLLGGTLVYIRLVTLV